jgi:hypothetical protein
MHYMEITGDVVDATESFVVGIDRRRKSKFEQWLCYIPSQPWSNSGSVPPHSANSGLPLPRSCAPEFTGLQLHPPDSHGFLHNEGLLSVFPFYRFNHLNGNL